jgi:hypothetical protein
VLHDDYDPSSLRPCICGKGPRYKSFYGDSSLRRIISPDSYAMAFCLLILFIGLIGFGILVGIAGPLAVLAFLLVLVLVLSAARRRKGHSFSCSTRWATIALCGVIGGWV